MTDKDKIIAQIIANELLHIEALEHPQLRHRYMRLFQRAIQDKPLDELQSILARCYERDAIKTH